ncbi:MAG: AIR synthase-related protein [Deltaproteobacteria bacterium]|nr:AIR synthase-related protein [Deltaproteobacteria bacterium]
MSHPPFDSPSKPAPDRYAGRGVSAQKEEVHAAISTEDPGLYPFAFTKLVADSLTGDPDYCLAVHADGAGTKSALAYLYFRETGDTSVFKGLAQDSLVMNTDDLFCVGAAGPFLLSNTIGRNKRLVPGEVIREIITGYAEQVNRFKGWGVEVVATGGETADVGDVVRTLLVDSTLTARLPRNRVVANDRVKPGDVIIGLASFGQAAYEDVYNSGIGSNGLTSARHDLLVSRYGQTYPETFEPGMPPHLSYCGPFGLQDPLESTPLTIGQALLSPTRSYGPLIIPLLAGYRDQINALVHCTGGGQTKCLRAGQAIHYIKDNLFEPPPLFAAIQRVTGTPWREMYQVFNMGHRMEIIGEPSLLPVVKELGQQFGVDVRQVGVCRAAQNQDRQDGIQGQGNRVSLHTPGGVEHYPA